MTASATALVNHIATLAEVLSTWPAADYDGIRQAAMAWHQLALDWAAANGTPQPWFPVTVIPGTVPAAHCHPTAGQQKEISEKRPAFWSVQQLHGQPELIKAMGLRWAAVSQIQKLPAALAAIDLAQARQLPIGLGLVLRGDGGAVAFDVDRKGWEPGPDGDRHFAAATAALTAWAAASGCYLETTPGGGLHLIGLRPADAPPLRGHFILTSDTSGAEIKAGEIRGGGSNGFLVVAPTFRNGKPAPYRTAMAPAAVALPPLQQLGIQPVLAGPAARAASTRKKAGAMSYAPAVAGPIDLSTVIQNPDSEHWFERELPARQIELAISMLQAVPRRGVPDASGTYDHAFRALAALVGWRGASEALSIVSLAGWDSQYWDVADKAADIARDPRSGIGALIKLARDHYGWRHPDEERIEASKAKNARRAAPPPPTSPNGEITTTTTATPQLMTATPPSQAQSSSNGNGHNGNGSGPGAAAGMPSTTPPPTPTELPTEAVLKLLRARARALLEQPMPPHERTFNLRALAHENDFTITPQEIQQLLSVARQDLRGKPLPLLTGQRIKVQRRRWLCEGLIPAGRATLLVSVPKVGKTTVLCALIAAWHYGAPDFLGMPFHGPCPPVLLLGPDMTMEDWADLLVPLGLARRIDDDDILGDEFELELLPPIAVLWHEGSGVVLDEEGLEAIEDKLRAHSGALLIGDSYTALVQHTGLDEWKPEFIGPLMDLKHICSLYGATSVMIHHSGKARAGERASSASRGGNALPAAVSQTISLRWLQEGGGGSVRRDNRVALSTEGRAGKPVEIVIQQEDDRRWTLLGDGASIEAEQTRLRKVDKISNNDRQAAVYTLILSRWTSRGLTTEVADLLEELPDSFTGTDRAREARNTLEQLRLTHQLVEQKNLPTADRGLVATYWPTGVERGDIAGLAAENKSEGVGDGVRSLAQGGTQDASLPSLPSSPAEPSSPLLTRITPLDMAPIPPAKNSPQEGKEPKEPSEVPPREGQKTPPDQLAPSVRGEEGSASPPTWLEHALAVRQEFPSATPFSIAVELQAIHGLRLATDTVQAALQAHDAAAAA